VITCPNCQKQNQDHYKFCLGCGAELPRGAAKSALEETVPRGEASPDDDLSDEPTVMGTGPSMEGTLDEPPPAPAKAPSEKPPAASAATDDVAAVAPEPAAEASTPPAAEAVEETGEEVDCPQCDLRNPIRNRFCASCGYRLDQGQPADARPAAEVLAETGVAVITALNPDGTEAGSMALPDGATTVGRDSAEIFAGDVFLSPKHATLIPMPADGKVLVRDEGSLNGVFRKLVADKRQPLSSGQMFRIGQELVRFDLLDFEGPDDDGVELLGSPAEGYVGRVSLVVGRESAGPSFPVPTAGVNLGRERGDVLFPDDGYVSGLHCRLSFDSDQVFLTDLGSSNGTFLRVLGEEELASGDIVLMGQQLFRITL